MPIDAALTSVERWPASAANHERAAKVMPGGNTRTQLYVAPFPIYAASASGIEIGLADGGTVRDFLLNYTSAAVGHCHPHVLEATTAALQRGGPYGLPSLAEVEFAEALVDRVPWIESVRFTNSGSEATLHALRAARAFTGRSMIAKAAGAYHGVHDFVDVSSSKNGVDDPAAHNESAGAPASIEGEVLVVRYNDLPATLTALDGARDRLAAVILEPFLNSAGVIAAEPDYFEGVFAWCREHDVLLIVDEVASFRVAYAGGASNYAIEPDLVTLGKAIGGGFAIGAVTGRADVMAVFDPRRAESLRHPGTFNGHPVTMAAGCATLEVLDAPAIARMNALGSIVAEGVRAIGTRHGIPLNAALMGSIGTLHASATLPRTAAEGYALPREQLLALYWRLLDAGYLIAPRGQFSISAQTTQEHVDGLLGVLDELAPAIFG